MFKLAPFRTSSQGFTIGSTPWAKPPGTHRAVVVGDSFTMPSGVALEDAFHTVAENHLNAQDDGTSYEVINFGVAGYDPSQYLANRPPSHPGVRSGSGPVLHERPHRHVPSPRRVPETYEVKR